MDSMANELAAAGNGNGNGHGDGNSNGAATGSAKAATATAPPPPPQQEPQERPPGGPQQPQQAREQPTAQAQARAQPPSSSARAPQETPKWRRTPAPAQQAARAPAAAAPHKRWEVVSRTPMGGGVLEVVAWDEGRFLRVWLPPGYSRLDAARLPYPVLYLNDGQNLFGDTRTLSGASWDAAAAAGEAIASGRLPPFLIVGVDHAGVLRSAEYTPVTPGSGPGGFRADAASWPGGGVRDYLARLRGEVVPWVAAAYAASDQPADLALGGSSFGGIAALAAALEGEACGFGAILVESPSLWIGDESFLRDVLAHPGPWPERALYAHLTRVGLGPARLAWTVEPDAGHTEAAWAARLPAALQFVAGGWWRRWQERYAGELFFTLPRRLKAGLAGRQLLFFNRRNSHPLAGFSADAGVKLVVGRNGWRHATKLSMTPTWARAAPAVSPPKALQGEVWDAWRAEHVAAHEEAWLREQREAWEAQQRDTQARLAHEESEARSRAAAGGKGAAAAAATAAAAAAAARAAAATATFSPPAPPPPPHPIDPALLSTLEQPTAPVSIAGMGGEWWVVALPELPGDAYEINFVFADEAESTFDNNGGADFFLPVRTPEAWAAFDAAGGAAADGGAGARGRGAGGTVAAAAAAAAPPRVDLAALTAPSLVDDATALVAEAATAAASAAAIPLPMLPAADASPLEVAAAATALEAAAAQSASASAAAAQAAKAAAAHAARAARVAATEAAAALKAAAAAAGAEAAGDACGFTDRVSLLVAATAAVSAAAGPADAAAGAAASRGDLYFTSPHSPVAGAPLTVYANRARLGGGLSGAHHISMHIGFNDWQDGTQTVRRARAAHAPRRTCAPRAAAPGPACAERRAPRRPRRAQVELRPTELPGRDGVEWWAARVQVPPEARNAKFVFSADWDGNKSWDNNGGNDYVLPARSLAAAAVDAAAKGARAAIAAGAGPVRAAAASAPPKKAPRRPAAPRAPPPAPFSVRAVESVETLPHAGGSLEVLDLAKRAPGSTGGGNSKQHWWDEKKVRVWLPPGFSADDAPPGGWPCVVMCDGANMFQDELAHNGVSWNLGEAAAGLISIRAIPPCVCVGVDSAGPYRSYNYLPFPPGTGEGGFREDAAKWPGGGAEEYLQRVVHELLPMLQDRYSIADCSSRLGFGGGSFGGVTALMAATDYPHVFGSVLVESPSLWAGEGKYLESLAAHTGRLPERLTFGCGTREYSGTRDHERHDIDQMLLAQYHEAARLLQEKGLRGPARFRFMIEEGAGHHEGAWRHRLGDALQFAAQGCVPGVEAQCGVAREVRCV
ncbi:ybbA [Scenedesmus sp. PABB004]|nr:ybbA [Scenedesmus sp. PABB004]